jgi:hypothetical protein
MAPISGEIILAKLDFYREALAVYVARGFVRDVVRRHRQEPREVHELQSWRERC